MGATKQPTYPKVAVFNLGRAHVWWKRERRSGVRRYLAPDLNGRIGEQGGKNWRQMQHAGEGEATHLWRHRRRCGNSTKRQISTRITCESLSTSTIATPLDPQEFPSPPLLSHTVFLSRSPKTYNNTTGSLSLSVTLHSFILSVQQRVCSSERS